MVSLIRNMSSGLDLINPRYKPLVNTAFTATVLAASTFLVPVETIKIIGLTVLTGVGYGIANDMIACRQCIEYFTVGHRYDGKELKNRPLKTLNPTLNALAWGMIATWHVCVVAGAILALVSRLPLPLVALKITAVQLAPCLLIGAVTTLFLAHKESRSAQKTMVKKPYEKYQGVPLNLQAGWEACNTRNSTGYAAIGLLLIALSVAVLAARVGLVGL